jgi:transcriptional regulator
VLEQPKYRMTDDEVAELVAAHPWASLISPPAEPGGDLVVSPLPVLLDPDSSYPVLMGHLAAEDAAVHQLGTRRVVVTIEGPSGYISPTWYESGPYVPTWNFVVAHFHGTPDVLDAEATYRILDATCAHLESARSPAWSMASVTPYAQRIAPQTTGFRLVPDRIVGKRKLSQDKPADVVDRVIRALRTDVLHGNAELAQAMERAHREA